MTEKFDVLVVGAGISGIGAGYHLQKKCPGASYVILEGRDKIGGTWDLFKYPGIRSDSDMYTLGFRFKPWKEQEAIADAPSILNYLNETVEQFNIKEKIRFGKYVRNATWSSSSSSWTVDVEDKSTNEITQLSCNFIFMCSGYYSYKEGYTPEFKGIEDFKGDVIHPQEWDENYDYSGKKVVVVGSGATAVTLVPEMAKKAGHVTMLQRSPTYVVSAPEKDKMANNLRKYLPLKLSYLIIRWRNILRQQYYFRLCRKYPQGVKRAIIREVKKALGSDYDVEKHFTPDYNPWEQRMCLVPDGDLFDQIRKGNASVVTDHIEKFTEKGILLKSGKEIITDIIITATGLNLEMLSNINLTVDNKPIDISQTITYKGMMYSGIPNFASTFGYTNASWTLGADLTSEYVCRVINHMKKKNYNVACPENDSNVETDPDYLNLTSGYIKRAQHIFPQQGKESPWRNNQNFLKDVFQIRYGRIDDGEITFSKSIS
ncbi:MAG: NAD(P)/FAD-dependent oxidoreductase [Pseudomonadota bacterium]|nr:NAD(P)/FAD-dependent oxidoreductase [Pseudomonadota bacterium]MEC7734905.1 NAD(P)/FAD-dependent oxidoreductase [Pseudomonadota bacterium]MEC7830578.1 NAD(P)/FAD-dependent oxidoreductase [Pseudomonadota bacterium]MEC9382546.1 NAD(P)/FAD-dependent oxidoreductase [Pseudomonadota bacterium]MEC9481302.1 NAD(P)/FAD-dependent oxidoreductase [Pseudomonadota bacterium]|tara:strand:+ start:285 stop:1745 length:1461 start_codon:yes stop_codon:yes gene_type:complete